LGWFHKADPRGGWNKMKIRRPSLKTYCWGCKLCQLIGDNDDDDER